MRDFLKYLSCIAALGLMATPTLAQDTAPTTAPAPAETTTSPAETTTPPAKIPSISMGTDVTTNEVGKTYVQGQFTDWELRCVHAPEGQKDPCQLYQLLSDTGGNPVAEISVFYLADNKGAAAGATVVTPLETLLTQQLRLGVDGGTAKVYPFAWCSKAGCFARLGFTADEITAFKRGANATVTIVPVAAPTKQIKLTVSLKGFTAGFDAVVAAATK